MSVVQRFPFRFTTFYRRAGLPFGVTPTKTGLVLTEEEMVVLFGLWRLRTPLANVASVETTGGFVRWKTAGPAHLSLADRGITFATNPDEAACLRFHEPVPALEPTGLLRHPGMTVTVADVQGLVAALS